MASLPKTPQFLKFIAADSCKYTKLRIPQKFVEKYGEGLSNPIHVELPSGEEWELEVTKTGNGEVWFDKNWTKFSEFYCLDKGNCVLFRYEGNSKFHISIFDRSATEIEYPLRTCPETEENNEEAEDDGSVEILEDLPCPPQNGRYIGSSKKASLTETEKAIALERVHAFKSARPYFKIALQPSYLMQLMLPSMFAAEHIQVQGGNAILKVSNGGGTWSVKFAYVKPKGRFLHGWSKFVRDNDLKVGDVCVFVLMNHMNLSFEVVFYRGGPEAAANCHPLSSPTPDYEEDDDDNDKSVEILDDFQPYDKKPTENSWFPPRPQPHQKINTCIKAACKEMKSEKSALGLSKSKMKHGVRSTHISKSSSRGKGRKAMALEKAIAYKSENPSFWISMKPSYINQSFMALRHEFARTHLSEKGAEGSAILWGPNAGTWRVKFGNGSSSSRPVFRSGWLQFVRDNNLQVDDVCVFILENAAALSFEVVIFRASEKK